MKKFLLPLVAFLTGMGFCTVMLGADTDIEAQLEAATRKATAREYDLKYRFQASETIRWQVSHDAQTETRIQGNSQTAHARSKSVKMWRVTDVDEEGKMTFVHMIDSVDMWQKLSDHPEVSYNSQTDRKPPLLYEGVADTVGVPIAKVVIDPRGEVLKREANSPNPNFGLGEITMPLPEKPVKIGARWYAPNTIRIRLDDGRVLPVKVRLKYTLRKVENDVAVIAVDTEVLTPGVNAPPIRVQLVQQLTEGVVFFDIEQGRITRKIIDWNETVVGFNGADSSMKYVAHFVEEIISSTKRTASADTDTKTQ